MKKTAFLATLALMSSAYAYEGMVKKGKLPATLEAMISKANSDMNLNYNEGDFELIEDRVLATSRFQFYVQKNSGIPVAQTAIRIWSDLKTRELILGELHLDERAKKEESLLAGKYAKARFSPGAFKSNLLQHVVTSAVRKAVSSHETDNRILGMKAKDMWLNGDLVRQVEVRGRRGVHIVNVSLLRNQVISSTYSEFPQSEAFSSLQANVFPMYEEVEGTGQRLPYEVRELKYVSTVVADGGEAPLGELGEQKFSENMYNPILAETLLGQMAGFWSEASMRRQTEGIIAKLPVRANTFGKGLLLSGKYATINLHPSVKEVEAQINFALKKSPHHIVSWAEGQNGYEARALSGLLGHELDSAEVLANRVPERLADHNPVAYINSGFDEGQVYYAVTAMMDDLNEMGMTDPELSKKPFHAFLYDQDISMQDNAYYYDNTINFTTYSSNSPNLARDNPTIWHELGHGIMDRLMGTHLMFADTKGSYGGLSEGMADFLAQIIVEKQTRGAPFAGKEAFRIINKTGFYLTNEYHDEGEAYGGAMNDMLMAAIAKGGKKALIEFTDLTLETMRLTRNHPALTARLWFEHMVYADSLGSDVRAPAQFTALINKALAKRNFAFAKDFTPAAMKVTFGSTELTSTSPASRERALTPCGTGGFVKYDLNLKLTAGDANFIKFPATVKVEYKKGALQGAIKWAGEASNPTVYTVNSEDELLTIPLEASTTCESVNQPDGSCKDYAYIQIWNDGETKPKAKKRFYLLLNTPTCYK